MHLALIITIVLLAGYIIYLHLQLVRKNILIEYIIRKISGKEKDLTTHEIKKLINGLEYHSDLKPDTKDRLFEDDIFNFIFENEKESMIYIHYTKEESVADTILKEGFRFTETFHKTALQVTRDKLDLMIKHNSKKLYGDFIIVICISLDIIKRYTAEMENAGIRNYSFENILSEIPESLSEKHEPAFLLPNQFIKGYINYKTGSTRVNPGFNQAFSSPVFSMNIISLKGKTGETSRFPG